MKNYYKEIIFSIFFDLLEEKEDYEIYTLNNVYGFSGFNDRVSKMHERDIKLLNDFKEVLDRFHE